MKKQKILIAIAVCFIVFLASCRTSPIYNVNQAPIPVVPAAQKPTLDQVQKAIVMAGAELNWAMNVQSPGHIVGTLNLRNHQAVVDINYNQTEYSITYKNSINLKYDGTKIHSNYNGWIKNLDNAIKRNLTNEVYK